MSILTIQIVLLGFSRIALSSPLYSSGVGFMKSAISEWASALKYRKYDLDQYREVISSKVAESIENFRRDQLLAQSVAQKDLESYMDKFNQLYAKNLATMEAQRMAIDEMRKRMELSRPPYIDDSLDQFRKIYNESIVVGPYEMVSKRWKWTFPSKNAYSADKPHQNDIEESLIKQTERLRGKFQSDRTNVFKETSETRRSSQKEGTIERVIRSAASDLNKLQEELTSNARQLAISTQNSIKTTIDKKDVRRETRNLEKQLEKLTREGSVWVDERISSIDATLKIMQEKLSATEKDFEELLFRRKTTIQYSSQNDATLNQILNLIDPSDKDWRLIKTEDGYSVFRKFLGTGPSAQYACVMCNGVINAPPKSVLALFEDNSRIGEYNSLCKDIRDVEYVGEDTKIVWIGSPPIFPFKPRDFCTVIHIRKLKDGTVVVLNRAVKHPLAPPTPQYQRAAIVLAANIIQPIPGDAKRCKLTMITQVDPGGFAPPVLINHLCTLGPIGFLKNIETAARKKPSKRVLAEKKRLAADMAKQLKKNVI